MMNITISRQSATNGLFVAQLVAERLNYRIYDAQLVDEIARRSQVDPDILHRFDEQVLNPVASMLVEWQSSLSPEVYLRHVKNTLRSIAREDNAIIIGRGANFVLRGPKSLHVRLVAPLPLRIAMYCAGEGVSEKEAEKWIKKQDGIRADYIKRYYNHNINDPVWYDLVINLDGLSLVSIADLIVQAAQHRQEEHLTAEMTLPKYQELLMHRHALQRPPIVQQTPPK